METEFDHFTHPMRIFNKAKWWLLGWLSDWCLLACLHGTALVGNVVLGRVGGEYIDYVGGLGLLADHLDEGLLDFYMRR